MILAERKEFVMTIYRQGIVIWNSSFMSNTHLKIQVSEGKETGKVN